MNSIMRKHMHPVAHRLLAVPTQGLSPCQKQYSCMKKASASGCGYPTSRQCAVYAGGGTGCTMYPHDCCNALSSSQIANLHACIDPWTFEQMPA